MDGARQWTRVDASAQPSGQRQGPGRAKNRDGALIGALAGIVALWAPLIAKGCLPDCTPDFSGVGFELFVTGAFGGIGAVVGALLGAAKYNAVTFVR